MSMHRAINALVVNTRAYAEFYAYLDAYIAFHKECNEATFATALATEQALFAYINAYQPA
jgi:hypothetical protein